MNKNINAVLIFFLLMASSCGMNDGESNHSNRFEQQQSEGSYRAVLTSLNSGMTTNEAFGTAMINVSGDEIEIKMNMIGTPTGIKHGQHIHTSGKCPQLPNDTNQDGIIDIKEGMNLFGPILIPLDSDLSSQQAGLSYSPVANGSGSYTYSEKTSLSLLLSDLQALDENPSDSIVKLKRGANLNLSGKTFVVVGVSALANIPETAASIQDQTNESTLPIACGKIVRIISE